MGKARPTDDGNSEVMVTEAAQSVFDIHLPAYWTFVSLKEQWLRGFHSGIQKHMCFEFVGNLHGKPCLKT